MIFEVDHWICKALHFAPSWIFPLALRRENGDRSSQNSIAICGTLPHHFSIGSSDSSCLAVHTIFLLSVREDGHRLVYAVRFGDGFDRSGGHLQAGQFLPEFTRGGPQNKTRFCTQRSRA